MLAKGVEAPHIYRGIAAYQRAFGMIDTAFAGGREWIAGDLFSIAEINLAPYCARLEYTGLLPIWLARSPVVTA